MSTMQSLALRNTAERHEHDCQENRMAKHILDADCYYEAGFFTLSFLPCRLPELFTVRFTAPVDFTAGNVFILKGREFPIRTRMMEEPAGKLFSAGAVVQCDIDMERNLAFVATGESGTGGGEHLGSALPEMNGIASAGSSTSASREDHVHPRGFTAAENAALESGMTADLRKKLEDMPPKAYMMRPDYTKLTPLGKGEHVFPKGSLASNGILWGPPMIMPFDGFFRCDGRGSFSAPCGDYATFIGTDTAGIVALHRDAANPTNKTVTYAFNDIPVKKGETVRIGAFLVANFSITIEEWSSATCYPAAAIEPKFQVFADKGSVASASALPASATDFDMYHVEDAHEDMYARYINGALTWQPVRAINQIANGAAIPAATVDAFNNHVANHTIHVTQSDKDHWNAGAMVAEIDAIKQRLAALEATVP